jgi:hypothetical protein
MSTNHHQIADLHYALSQHAHIQPGPAGVEGVLDAAEVAVGEGASDLLARLSVVSNLHLHAVAEMQNMPDIKRIPIKVGYQHILAHPARLDGVALRLQCAQLVSTEQAQCAIKPAMDFGVLHLVVEETRWPNNARGYRTFGHATLGDEKTADMWHGAHKCLPVDKGRRFFAVTVLQGQTNCRQMPAITCNDVDMGKAACL